MILTRRVWGHSKYRLWPLTIEFLRNLNVKNCEPFELYFLSFFILLLTIGIMTSSQLNKWVESACKQCHQKMWRQKTGMNCRCKRTNEFFCSDRRYTSSLTEFEIYFSVFIKIFVSFFKTFKVWSLTQKIQLLLFDSISGRKISSQKNSEFFGKSQLFQKRFLFWSSKMFLKLVWLYLNGW